MAIATGTKLGPYEVLGALGAGGMGEVYRACDTRLERTVAIKVLPSHLSANADLKQRFEREAKAISSLNHPHICTLHDVGSQDGVDYLVMEYLEGETLADRLVKGPLKIDEATRIAVEVADALDKAHRQGIVHRDLKPGNVMLTKSGAKLMDFGLAKPAAMAMGVGSSSHPSKSGLGGPPSPNTPTMSVAALTSPASPLTQKGTIVGTFQYMAPEVLQGTEADARSDIFSFGCLLYEMITGRRAFEGKSQVSVLAAILDREPEPVTAVQPMTPPALEFCIRTCLAKDPEERFQTAHDASLQLRWASTSSAIANSATSTPAVTKARPVRRLVFATVGTIGLVIAALGGYWLANGRGEAEPLRATIETPDKMVVDSVGDFAGAPVLSPDGRKLLFEAHTDKTPKALWVRALDNFAPQRLDGTDGANHPFWSADSNSIGFFANSKLCRMSAAGGPVTCLAPAPNARGGTWTKDNLILYTPDFQTAIYKINADGGTAETITRLDTSRHSTHRWPFALPDGRHFLYLATSHTGGNSEQNGIYYASLDGKENKFLVSTDGGAEYATGYLLYHGGTSLVAQKFDPASGRLSGSPQPIVDKVRNDSGVWRTLFTVSQTGRMVYQVGSIEASGSQLVWYDRTGKQLSVVGPHGSYMDPRLSPDGKHLAVSFGDPSREIYVFDLERGTQTRLTFLQQAGSPGAKIEPAWSSDGKQIAYQYSQLAGGQSAPAFVKASNGGGQEKELLRLKSGTVAFPQWSPDGKYIVYIGVIGPSGNSVYAAPAGGGDPITVVTPASPQANVSHFRISPNGRWIAYTSNESGRPEVYVAPFPKGDEKWQVSTDGATYTSWRGDSKELYYSSFPGTEYWGCEVKEEGTSLTIATPKKLFSSNPVPVGVDFDVTADGKKFLVNVADNDQSPATLHLVTNWTADLKKK